MQLVLKTSFKKYIICSCCCERLNRVNHL